MSALRRLLRGKRRCAADDVAERFRNDAAETMAGVRNQRLELERLVKELAGKGAKDV